MTWVAGRSPNVTIDLDGLEMSFYAEVCEAWKDQSPPFAEHWLWRVLVVEDELPDDTVVVEASTGSEGRAIFAATLALTAVTLT